MAKMKIPKRVAGVKIPKKVRRRAKKAVRMAESPVVREFAAAALGAAASKAKGARAATGELRAAADAARAEVKAAADAARADANAARAGARAAADAARAEARATRLAARAASGDARFEHEAVIEIDGERLVRTIRAAALNGLRSFIEGLEEGLRELDAAAEEQQGRRRRANGSPAGAADA